MPYNGSGVFNRLYSWVNDAAANIKIRADRMDNEMNGMAVALSTAITKDGQTTITANLPMAGFRHTGVGNAASRTDYAAFGQVQDGKAAWVDGGGTADAITAAYSIPITTLVDGQLCYVRATAANATTTPTFSPNGLTARTIVKNGGQALAVGDIAGDGHELELRYDLTNTRWELMNPKTDMNKSVYDPANISQQVVGTTATQTLTNKTLTSPVINGTISGSAAPKINNFRLTLTTGVPVTQSDVTSSTSIFQTPYDGNGIALYNGTTWELLNSAQVSLALSGMTANRPYDVFAFNSGGTLTLEILAWTSDTARATALVYQDGMLVRSGSLTRRYLGTFYATGATTTADTSSTRYLWNYYNRAVKGLYAGISTASYTYSTATWRAANANTTNGDGRFSFVCGLAEDRINVTASRASSNSTSNFQQNGIAINGTTNTELTGVTGAQQTSAVATHASHAMATPREGLNFIQAMETSSASGVTTWYGASTGGGMTGSWNC